MDFWKNIKVRLDQFDKLILLLVVQSKGSSPGKQGFKMVIMPDGSLSGSIGGGIMEYELVEKAKALFKNDWEKINPKLIHQVHGEDNQFASGMICSGTQTIAIIPIDKKANKTINNINNIIEHGKQGVINFISGKIDFMPNTHQNNQFSYSYQSDSEWVFSELAGYKNKMYIVGGGHVGFALSKIMYFLGFHVCIFDHRDDLNTMKTNQYCHEKIICGYNKINSYIEASNHSYIAILSHSHKSDALALQSLINIPLRYIGMMGSEQKINKIYKTLINNGIDKEKLEQVHAPIGLDINSISPEEIAISIASQIIAIKNS